VVFLVQLGVCQGGSTESGGHGGAWEGRWGLYKDPQRPPVSRFPPPMVRARGFSHTLAVPTHRALLLAPRDGRRQVYGIPTARVITPRARVESQRGELRPGTGERARGFSHTSAVPARSALLLALRGGRGQGCSVPTARVITPCARVEPQRGELKPGIGERTRQARRPRAQ